MTASDLILPDKTYAAFLFDMDGTIINSIAAAERVWGRWAADLGLDVEAFLPTMHGRRGIDTIAALNLPGLDPLVEADKILQGEIDDVEGIVTIPGAADFLSALPENRWAVVTSAPLELAKRRLAAAGLPLPRTIVSAEDVEVGKPDPEGYKLAAQRLGVSSFDILVFEDVMAGVIAGERAGGDVMVITATHVEELETGHPKIPGYLDIAPYVGSDGRLSIRLK